MLQDNELTGTIPTELGNLASLWILDLGDNQLVEMALPIPHYHNQRATTRQKAGSQTFLPTQG